MRDSRHLRCAPQHTSEGSPSWVFVQRSSSFGEDSGGENDEIMQSLSRGSPEAVLRCRCQVITGLVQGKSPKTIAAGGLCSASQVYRVAHRFVEQGLAGLADRREDNGQDKVTETYESELLSVLAGSPRDHGYLRPTWTQELLALVLAARTGIGVSVSTMSRLLKRLGVRLGRPNRPWAVRGPSPASCGGWRGFGGSFGAWGRARSPCTKMKWTSI